MARTDGAARGEPNLFGLSRVVTEEGEANRWSSERRAELVRAIPSRDRGRRSQPMEQREPSSSLEWSSRDRGRQSQNEGIYTKDYINNFAHLLNMVGFHAWYKYQGKNTKEL